MTDVTLDALEPMPSYEPIYRLDKEGRRVAARVLDSVMVEMTQAHGLDPLNNSDAIAGIILAPVNASGKTIPAYFPAISVRASMSERLETADPADFYSMSMRNELLAAAHGLHVTEGLTLRHVATFFARGVDHYSVRDLSSYAPDSKLMRATIFFGQRQHMRLSVNNFGQVHRVEAEAPLTNIVDTFVHHNFVGVNLDERFRDGGFEALSDDEATVELNRLYTASATSASSLLA